MGRLPALRVREVVSALERAGFYLHHQTGGHAAFRHVTDASRRVTVPVHRGDVKRGTLQGILRQAGLPEEDFRKLL